MSRPSKIACLPQAVRDEVNQRLADGQTGASIADWLNDLPEVTAVLRERFNNEPVSEPNLSSWRLGGYQDYLERRDRLDLARELASVAASLAAANPANPATLASGATVLLAVRLFQALETCDPADQPDRFRHLGLALAELRAADRAAQRLQQEDRRLALEERRVKVLEKRLATRNGLPPLESKGGITPETLARIEKELHIL